MAKQRKTIRNKFLSTSAMALATTTLIMASAKADDAPWVFSPEMGSFTTDVSLPNTTNIDQTSQYAGGSGNTSIPLNYTVNINQNAGAWFVAKDNTGHETAILGRLNATAGVIVLNQNGVIFGKDARVDVGAIVASTGKLNEQVLLHDGTAELSDFGDAAVINNGTVSVSGAGLAAFVAPTVVNNGIISAKLGKVVLAAGNTAATVDLYGDGLVSLAVSGKAGKILSENKGSIEGKTVLMTAEAAKDVVDTVVNMSGVINASSVSEQGGKIILGGGKNGVVKVSGKLDASGEKGGVIKVTGRNVWVDTLANLLADGGQNGDGGEIRVIGDNAAIIEGKLNARGGAVSGNGGFVEVSGLNYLDFTMGNVDTTAANGLTGTLLIDPLDITIRGGNGDGHDNGGAAGAGTSGGWENLGSGNSGSIPFAEAGAPFDIYESEIEKQSLTTNIIIQAQRNITTVAGGDNLVTLANNRSLTIETQNNSGNNGSIDLTNLGFQVQGTGSMNITAATGTVGTGDVRVGRLLAANGSINVSTDNGQIYLEKGAINVSGTGAVGFNASDRIFLDNDITTNGGGVVMQANSFTIDDTDAGSDNLDQIKTNGGFVRITANEITLGETGGDPAPGETLIDVGNSATILIERKTAGTIGLGGATGNTMLSDGELASLRARELFIGGGVLDDKTTAIYVDSVNTTANILGRVTLSNYLNQADGVSVNLLGAGAVDNNNVMFSGVNTFNALTVNANDHIVTYGTPTTTINTVTGDMVLNADANAQGIGALLMSFNSGINTNGRNFTYNGHEAIIGQNAKINAQGGNILLDNKGVFYAVTPDSLITSGSGKITLNQWAATFADPSNSFGPRVGSINNAGNAILNTGTGQNTVNVGAGTFDETVQLAGQSNLWIKGAGQGVTIVKPTALGSAPALSNGTPWDGQTYTPVFLAKDANNVDVTGLTIDGTNVDSGTTAGLAYYNAGGKAENVTILNGGAFGLYAVADSTKGHTARTVTATNVTSSGNSWAALAVIGNVLTANVTGGVYNGTGGSEAMDLSNGSKGTITNATITTGSNSENAGIVFHGGHDWTITGGSITGSNAASTGIVDLGAAYGVPAATNVAINGVTISNINTGVSANGGSNWDIDGGTYTGAAGATGTGVKFANLTGSNSTVKNLTVSSFNEGVVVDAAAGTQVTGNLIKNILSNAVSVINSTSVQVLNNVIGYTTLAATTEAGSNNIGGDGIKVNNGGSVVVKGNKIAQTNGAGAIEVINTATATIGGAGAEGNRIRNSNGGDGIRMENDSNVTVENNNIDGTNRVGIWGGWVNTATIKNNIVQNDHLGGYGSVHADFGSNWTVTGNDIDGGDYGIRLNTVGGTNTINGTNKIDNVTADAIYVVNTTGLTIASNQIGVNGGNVAGNGIWSLNNDDANIYSNIITGAGKDGILVQGGNNVNIGGNGANTIKKSGDDGIDVENTTGTVVVKNNVIEETGLDVAPNQYQSGIEVSGTTGATIELNRIKKAAWDGINVQQSSGTVIKSNQIFDTLDQAGISAHNGSSNITIDDNVITKSVQYGVWVNGVTGPLTITNNDISDIKLVSGILVSGSTGTIKINNNDIYNVGNDGITAYGDIDEVNGNRILKTGANGINVANSANVDIKANKIGEKITGTNAATRLRTTTGVAGGSSISSSNSNNTASASNIGDDGIHVESSDYAEIIGNTVSNTVDDGIYINPSHYSVIAGNTLTALGNDGIESNGNNHITIGGPLTTDANTISGAGAHGINVHGGVSALIQNNTVKGGSGSLLGAAAGAQLDGIHVENNNGVEILNNTITAGQGFTLTIPFVGTLSLNGGNGANQNGIFVANSNNAVIDTNMILPDQLGSGLGAVVDGIHVEDSDNLTVGGLIPVLNGNKILSTGRDGINIDGSNGAFVLNNIISGANVSILGVTIGGEIGDDGIDMNDTLGTLVAGNIITNTTGDGIEFSNGALSAIGLNFITDAGDDGIDISNSTLLAVGLNQIDGTANNGIELSATSLSLVGWNNISNAGRDGINALLGAGLLITNNTIKASGDDGIDAALVLGLGINDNTIEGAGDNGIEASFVALAEINDNKVGLAGANIAGNGIDLRNSAFVDINGNDVGAKVRGNGIFVDPSFDITIDNNDVNGVGADGIHAIDTFGLTISNNRVNNSGDDGIEVGGRFGVDNAEILKNVVTGSAVNGLYVSGQNNGSVVLKGNAFTDNPTGARFESGLIDLTGLGADKNTFTNGDKGMVFDPTAKGNPNNLVLVGDTIGETEFVNQSTYYVELVNGAFFAPGTPTILDGYHATYDGFRPDTVPFLTVAQYNAIESKIQHYVDDQTLGLFFFGAVPDLSDKDLYRDVAGFGGAAGKFRVTILGMPRVSAGTGSFAGGGNIANLLASISPAAGGNAKAKPTTAQDLANLEPSAGGDVAVGSNDNAVTTGASDSACWSQAVASASSGAAADYSFGGSMEEALTQTASCAGGSQL